MSPYHVTLIKDKATIYTYIIGMKPVFPLHVSGHLTNSQTVTQGSLCHAETVASSGKCFHFESMKPMSIHLSFWLLHTNKAVFRSSKRLSWKQWVYLKPIHAQNKLFWALELVDVTFLTRCTWHQARLRLLPLGRKKVLALKSKLYRKCAHKYTLLVPC